MDTAFGLTLNREDLAKPREHLVATLREVAGAYGERGVTLALENHFLLDSATLAAIVAAADRPSLGVCLDVANSTACGEWPEKTVEMLAPYAVNLHLKDYRFEIDTYGVGFRAVGTPLGEGELDIPYVFNALEEAGREVNVILEHWLPLTAVERDGLELEDVWTGKSIEAVQVYLSG